jgi:hypothetical protein
MVLYSPLHCLTIVLTVMPTAPCAAAVLQALCRLVWCLGKLGYRPAGGALTGWLAERLAASSSSSSDGVTLVSSYSCGQLALLLSGLRGCKVVLGGRWLQQLLAHSTAQAQQMPLEVRCLAADAAACGCVAPSRGLLRVQLVWWPFCLCDKDACLEFVLVAAGGRHSIRALAH